MTCTRGGVYEKGVLNRLPHNVKYVNRSILSGGGGLRVIFRSICISHNINMTVY